MSAWTSRVGIAIVVGMIGGCGDDAGGGGGSADTGPPPCAYPASSGMLTLGEVMPPFRWNGVLDPDGVAQDLDIREFYCDARYDRYRGMILIVGAGWCAACPEYIRNVDAMAGAFEENGILLAYLEVETADFEPATSMDAKEFIDGLIMDGPGLRMGDADNTMTSAVRNLVTQFPSAYFIRRRDMQITADQSRSIYTIDWPTVAADPEAPWMPTEPPFVASCGMADEESGEPNDSFETARTITPDGVEVMGGICADPPSDFYRIDVAGAWRFDLYTNVFEGDINLRLWSDTRERIGGSDQRSNHDWIDYMGPAWVEVYGHQRASNVYRVTLTAM